MSTFNSVTVGNPQRRGEAVGSYTIYPIEVVNSGAKSTVLRRYSDFEWLRKILQHSCDCVIIPPLPDKQVIGRFDSEFLQVRRQGLETFLKRCIERDQIVQEDAFVKFLSLEEREFLSYKSDHSAPSKGKSKLLGFVSAAAKSVSNRMGNKTTIARTTEDISFAEIKAYLEGLKPILTALHEAATRLASQEASIGQLSAQFGEAYRQLGRCEGDALGAALATVGKATASISFLKQCLAEGELKWFIEGFADADRVVDAALDLFTVRDEQQNVYHNALHTQETKRTAVSKLQGISTPQASEQRETAQAQLQEAEANVTTQKKALSSINKKILKEFEQFRDMHIDDFNALLMEFAVANSRMAQAEHNIWAAIQEEIINNTNKEIGTSESLTAQSVPEGTDHDHDHDHAAAASSSP